MHKHKLCMNSVEKVLFSQFYIWGNMQEIIQNHSVNYEPSTNIQKMLLSLPYMGNENY